MYEFYTDIRVGSEKSKKCTSFLNGLYSQISTTKGCMENLNNCGAWCCCIQTPQFLYSEFLNVWYYVSRNFSEFDGLKLIEKCMMNAVDTRLNKKCVFFDEEKKMCSIHKVRPYNCRIYGIIPEEEFKNRYEKLKDEYKNNPLSVIKQQCDLVSTNNDDIVTIEDTNKWWKKLEEIEHKLGIPRKFINDDQGGSYRSPHDHILLYLMPENVLTAIAGIRMYDDENMKKIAIGELISVIKGVFYNGQ